MSAGITVVPVAAEHRAAWEELYAGYAAFYRVEQTAAMRATVWGWLLDPAHEVDCSFKAGDPGFVRVTGPSTLEFPDYDGNLMFRTLGNIAANPNVGMLFIRFGPVPKRIRVNGRATLIGEPARVMGHHGAKALIEVACTDIFPNCPRYIPDLAADAVSAYVPRPGHTLPFPEWKTYPFVTPLLPETDPHKHEIATRRNGQSP